MELFQDQKHALGLYHFNQDGLHNQPHGRIEPRALEYVPKTLDEFELLRSYDFKTLIDMGCRIWTRTEHATIWLFPVEWYESLIEGMAIMTLGGETAGFDREEYPKDSRLGVLCFGFYQCLN